MHRPCHCVKASGGTWVVLFVYGRHCSLLYVVVVGFQTTRIKGIMPKGLEVELDLLSVKESVELLAVVAEINGEQTPPCCLEIAQLCGRLPLCLNVRHHIIE